MKIKRADNKPRKPLKVDERNLKIKRSPVSLCPQSADGKGRKCRCQVPFTEKKNRTGEAEERQGKTKQTSNKEGEQKTNVLEMFLVQKLAISALLFLGVGMLLVAVAAMPVLLIVAIIYNSPFAIFFPPLESGDTVTTVTSACVAEFDREVFDLASAHTGYDIGEIVYVDYEVMDQNGGRRYVQLYNKR